MTAQGYLFYNAPMANNKVEVDLNLTPQPPPEILYHGTAEQFLISIRQQGLIPMQRNHVHLSRDSETAKAVGRRYGQPVLIEVLAEQMYQAGHAFLVSEDGVWLTLHVPVAYMRFPEVKKANES